MYQKKIFTFFILLVIFKEIVPYFFTKERKGYKLYRYILIDTAVSLINIWSYKIFTNQDKIISYQLN